MTINILLVLMVHDLYCYGRFKEFNHCYVEKRGMYSKIQNWLVSTDKLDKQSMWVCATSMESLYANLNFNIPVPVGLACENPARIRE